MERPLDPGAVVAAELADARDDVRDVLGRDLASREDLLAAGEARLGQATEIHDRLEQAVETLERPHARREVRGQSAEESF